MTKTPLVAAVEQILMQFPFYGYRKVRAELKRRGIAASEYQVRHLLRMLGIIRSVGKVQVQTTDSNHPHPRYPNRIRGLEPTRPDQIWVADISYIRLGKCFIYLAVILDAFTRTVCGWALSRRVDLQLTLAALEMALQKAIPFIFHSDQGSQYAAWEHTDRLRSLGVKISMSDKSCPTQNGIAERCMRTLKEEHVITPSTLILRMLSNRSSIGSRSLT
jgi:putative transposase